MTTPEERLRRRGRAPTPREPRSNPYDKSTGDLNRMAREMLGQKQSGPSTDNSLTRELITAIKALTNKITDLAKMNLGTATGAAPSSSVREEFYKAGAPAREHLKTPGASVVFSDEFMSNYREKTGDPVPEGGLKVTRATKEMGDQVRRSNEDLKELANTITGNIQEGFQNLSTNTGESTDHLKVFTNSASRMNRGLRDLTYSFTGAYIWSSVLSGGLISAAFATGRAGGEVIMFTTYMYQLLGAIGGMITDGLEPFAEALNPVIDGLRRAADASPQWLDTMIALAVLGVGAFITMGLVLQIVNVAVGGLITGLGWIVSIAKGVGAAFGGISIAISPIVGMLAAVAATGFVVVAAFATMSGKSREFLDTMREIPLLGPAIEKAFDGVMRVITAMANAVVATVNGLRWLSNFSLGTDFGMSPYSPYDAAGRDAFIERGRIGMGGQGSVAMGERFGGIWSRGAAQAVNVEVNIAGTVRSEKDIKQEIRNVIQETVLDGSMGSYMNQAYPR